MRCMTVLQSCCLSLTENVQEAAAVQGISASGCGLDIACVCGNDEFLALLQNAVLTECAPADQASM